jgi:hypothetical protein
MCAWIDARFDEEASVMRDGLQDMSGRVKDRWEAARMNNLDRQNGRLRDEVSHLRTQLEDERSETQDLKDVLRSGPKVVKVKKRGGLLRMAVVGGVAYVVGTRDGRERYDQIVTWVRSMRSKMERKADAVTADVEATASQISNGAEGTIHEAQSVSRTAGRTTTEQRNRASGSGS